MTPHGRAGISPRQMVAARHLAATGDAAGAAAAASVSHRTIRRWLTQPWFREAVRAEARAMSADAATALLGAMGDAVATLREALRGGTSATRVRAARTLLEIGLRVADGDIDERLSALERRADSWDGGGKYTTGTTGWPRSTSA